MKLLEKRQKNVFFKNLLKKNKCGIYYHGKVGRGKSIILNAFERELSDGCLQKHHFNELVFKLQRISFSEKETKKLIEEKIIFESQKFIFVDEIDVDNIADLQLLFNFMGVMAKEKIFMLFTSNHHPRNIYKKNYNSKKVSDFCSHVEKLFNVFEFKSKRDYRQDLKIFKNFYLDGVYKDLLEIEFNEICGKNFGHKDYEMITKKINFIFIKNLPTLKKTINDKIITFMILIDIIYEKKKILSLSLMNPLNEIFPEDKNNINFDRTFSRLNEMRSEKYIFKNINKTIDLK